MLDEGVPREEALWEGLPEGPGEGLDDGVPREEGLWEGLDEELGEELCDRDALEDALCDCDELSVELGVAVREGDCD